VTPTPSVRRGEVPESCPGVRQDPVRVEAGVIAAPSRVDDVAATLTVVHFYPITETCQ
jgi:hypothetical protein